ncbi:YphA family membrane protein [Oceanobacillus chungangensis]|uniref:Uncharacterized protein n=1 Tax=Oceanobacillus chungangensis TaxID=1229152 RepID=A0A3D8Q179_9BACI|nr:hypothetical protein [Oceanobacillus chungangensis]RDW22034.1 hypothetical protein CWR45_00660 [Oceanobacillus chungangensis]
MESGILFYWFSWILWIIATFILEKNRLRTFMAGWILLSITGTYVNLEIINQTFSLAFIILFGGSTVLLARNEKLLYHTFSALTLTIGFASFRIWEVLSPMLKFLPSGLLITLLFSLLTCILTRNYYSRLSVCILGMLTGEMIYQLTLSYYGFNEVIGELFFFDHLLSTVLFITFLEVVYKVSNATVNWIRNFWARLRLQNQ